MRVEREAVQRTMTLATKRPTNRMTAYQKSIERWVSVAFVMLLVALFIITRDCPRCATAVAACNPAISADLHVRTAQDWWGTPNSWRRTVGAEASLPP